MSDTQKCSFCHQHCICKAEMRDELSAAQSRTTELEAENKRLRDFVSLEKGARCGCGDIGYIVVRDSDGEPEQCQCEFCYTVPNSEFNRLRLLSESALTQEVKSDE